MNKLNFLWIAFFVLVFHSCEQCYTCRIENTSTYQDYCGKRKELKKSIDLAESVGFKCEKR